MQVPPRKSFFSAIWDKGMKINKTQADLNNLVVIIGYNSLPGLSDAERAGFQAFRRLTGSSYMFSGFTKLFC